jgi:hypothetical protein
MEIRDMQKYDAIIIGTGRAGPPPAARLVDAGMNRRDRAKIVRRYLRQHWLHSNENPGRKCLCGDDRPGRLISASDWGVNWLWTWNAVRARKDAISGQSRTGVESWMKGPEILHRLRGSRAFPIPPWDCGWQWSTGGRKNLHQCRGPRVGAAVAEILEQEGIDIRLNAKCLSVAEHDQEIWALGDCNGKGAFTHTSYNDFEIVAANLLDNDRRSIADRVPAYSLYIDPPLGRAGMTERQVRERKEPALIAKRPMTKVSRAVEKGETQGFMKILVDAGSKRILGASILGVGGDEVVHCILDLMYARVPYTVLQRAMHIHPTVSELLPTMMGELKSLAPSFSDDGLGVQPNSRDAR